MIFKFLLISDEVDNFVREIEINSYDTFLDLHKAIVESVGYDKNYPASFIICTEDWEKKEEITLLEMDTTSEYDNFLMEDTQLDEFLNDEGDRMLYMFDYLTERSFFIELKEVVIGKDMHEPLCSLKRGNAPKQVEEFEAFTPSPVKIPATSDFDEDFYGDEGFDDEELEDIGDILEEGDERI